VKQPLRRFDEEKRRAMGEEIHKLMAAGFIKEVFHPEWLACNTRVLGVQSPGVNIITRCAGTKSHTYDESWHRIECHIFTT
jgi:hypothetical protein